MPIWQWSKTPASNATADPTIAWPEGQSPSSVNDSARAMMAALASWRDDTSGLLVDTGSASAYAVASNEGLNATPLNGQRIVFTPANTNNAGVTLAVDVGNAFPIQTSPGVAVGAAVMVAGTPYAVTFNTSVNAWILNYFVSSPFIIPLGSMLDYTGSSAPNSNFVFPAGQAISRTTYAAYFAMVSTTFGAGDGVTTFNVPDLRGRVLASLDNMGGTPANRLNVFAATTMGANGGQQNETIVQGNLPSAAVLTTTIAAGQGSHTHTVTAAIGAGGVSGGAGSQNTSNSVLTTSAATLPAMSGTTPLGGSDTPLPIVQPTMVVNKILRIF